MIKTRIVVFFTIVLLLVLPMSAAAQDGGVVNGSSAVSTTVSSPISSTVTTTVTNPISFTAASVVYMPLIQYPLMPIYGEVGDTFFLQGTEGLRVESEWGLKVHSVESDGNCRLDQNGTVLDLFCESSLYKMIFSSEYGNRVEATFGAGSPDFLFLIFGDNPLIEEMPYVVYTSDQKVGVAPASYQINIANMGQTTRVNSVYLNLPDKDVVETGALPGGCENPEDSGAIVCYIYTVEGVVDQLNIPLTWKKEGSYQVETFVLDEGHLIRGGRLFRTITVGQSQSTAVDTAPERDPHIIHTFDQYTLVNDNAYYAIQVANLGKEIASNTMVTMTLPSASVVDVGTLPTFCVLTNRNVVCSGVNVPAATIVKIRIPLTWKSVGTHQVDTFAVDSNGALLRGGHLLKKVVVLQQQ